MGLFLTGIQLIGHPSGVWSLLDNFVNTLFEAYVRQRKMVLRYAKYLNIKVAVRSNDIGQAVAERLSSCADAMYIGEAYPDTLWWGVGRKLIAFPVGVLGAGVVCVGIWRGCGADIGLVMR